MKTIKINITEADGALIGDMKTEGFSNIETIGVLALLLIERVRESKTEVKDADPMINPTVAEFLKFMQYDFYLAGSLRTRVFKGLYGCDWIQAKPAREVSFNDFRRIDTLGPESWDTFVNLREYYFEKLIEKPADGTEKNINLD